MKRCPLCDFIYEDDQGVCDMDGIELVHDGGELTPAAKDSTPRRPAAAGSARRRRSLQLVLGFGLGAAIFSAYYSSVNRAAPAGGGQASTSYTARPAPPVVEATPERPAASLPTPPAETPAPPPEETTPSPAPRPAPPVELRAAGTVGKRPRPGGGNKKKESKLASILNKTGRMLKKPFGF